MRRSLACTTLAVALAGATPAAPDPTPAHRLTREALEDKVRGGWAAQMIGVSFGAPTEFRSNGKIIEGKLPWTPDRVSNAIHQDDLYVDMTFAAVMDRVGLDATTKQYGEAFKQTQYPLWHANAGARRLLQLGLEAPLSGDPRHNIHANDIDFQIEADFIGLMTPGLPQDSNRYCERVGRVMNHGDGLYGGMFIAGMYAAAFFEKDVARIVDAGLATIPAQSGYARIVRDAVEQWRHHPDDWRAAWREIQARWDRDDSCPDGALLPFNIDAQLNGAYVTLGLLYGGGDFARTLDVTTRMGQDSDCNPASAAGVLGVVLGYSGIPDAYKSGIAPLADTKFDYTPYSFNDITRSTVERALQVIKRAGGKVSADEVVVPAQKAVPAKLEQWDMGVPRARVDASDDAWRWSGDWKTDTTWDGTGLAQHKTATAAGSEATLTFEGTAVALVGKAGQDGGRADVFVDGKKAGTLDAWSPERTNDDDLWHAYGLRPGKHTLRLVTRTDADARSRGHRVPLEVAVVYAAR